MSERERIEQSNAIAIIVFDQIKRVWPDLHPVLDLRYGIADAVWDAGYRLARPEPPADARTGTPASAGLNRTPDRVREAQRGNHA